MPTGKCTIEVPVSGNTSFDLTHDYEIRERRRSTVCRKQIVGSGKRCKNSNRINFSNHSITISNGFKSKYSGREFLIKNWAAWPTVADCFQRRAEPEKLKLCE